MIRAIFLSLTMIFTVMAGSGFAVEPDEVLSDPVLESRAREISKILRCPVCQGETIDDSHADKAKDMRIYVRDMLLEGHSDAVVIEKVVAGFGEEVLFEPKREGWNLVLWGAGPLLLLVGGFAGWTYIRNRQTADNDGLSADEETRLAELMKDADPD